MDGKIEECRLNLGRAGAVVVSLCSCSYTAGMRNAGIGAKKGFSGSLTGVLSSAPQRSEAIEAVSFECMQTGVVVK
jgi:hypothetical protein